MLLRCDVTDENAFASYESYHLAYSILAVSAERPNNVLMRRDSNSFFFFFLT